MADQRLEIEQIGGVTVAGLCDPSILDAVTIDQIARELYDLVETKKAGKIVLDFAAVRFLSSQALSILLNLRRKGEAIKARIVLCSIKPELARVFKITSLDRVFDAYDNRTAALAAFGVKIPEQKAEGKQKLE